MSAQSEESLIEGMESLSMTSQPGGGELEDDNSPKFIQITVKSMNGSTAAIEINPQSRVSVLMDKINAKLGISPSEQRLIFSGKQLDPVQPLSAYGVEAGSMITLVLRLRGGN